nr:uncharacterized protein LOC113828146 [Penaeus vannamei]
MTIDRRDSVAQYIIIAATSLYRPYYNTDLSNYRVQGHKTFPSRTVFPLSYFPRSLLKPPSPRTNRKRELPDSSASRNASENSTGMVCQQMSSTDTKSTIQRSRLPHVRAGRAEGPPAPRRAVAQRRVRVRVLRVHGRPEEVLLPLLQLRPEGELHDPPSAATPGEKSPADQPPARPPLDDEDVADPEEAQEEGSGTQPWGEGYYNVRDPVEDDLERRKTESPGRGGDANDPRDDKNPRDNETHGPRPWCGPLPCRKTCPHGYKVDPTTGCRKCKCFKCQPLRRCSLKCRFGYVADERGCKKCQCGDQGAKVSVITSLDDNEFIVDEGYGVSSEVFSNGTYAEVAESGGVYVTAGEEETQEPDPSCNTTRVEGCIDGRGVYAVGTWWERGACVSCTCVAPGYTECNVTQCAPPPCPAHRQKRLRNECCPICSPACNRGQGRGHESRSTSRVPLDRMPPPTLPQDNQDPVRAPEMPDEDAGSHRSAFGSGSTTKSAVQGMCEIKGVSECYAVAGSAVSLFWVKCAGNV